jgi:hypothetical protein
MSFPRMRHNEAPHHVINVPTSLQLRVLLRDECPGFDRAAPEK